MSVPRGTLVRMRHDTALRQLILAVLLLVQVVVGCAGSDSGGVEGTGTTMPDTESPTGGTRLVVTMQDGAGGPPLTRTLTCDPPGGDHPDPQGACRALAAARAPFAPVPAGLLCTQIYGGPETATIEGTWRGEPVRAAYRRTDGCEIARWAAVAAVLR